MNTQQAYPLSWPIGWQRTPSHRRAKAPFYKRSYSTSVPNYTRMVSVSMNDVSGEIQKEVRALGGQSLVISTNVELRQDGLPYSNRRAPDDPGAAVYFRLFTLSKDRPIVFACDKWNRVEDNLRAIAKHIEALRGQERWGVGSRDQAFTGYTALPGPGQTASSVWWEILGVNPGDELATIKKAWIAKSWEAHPDHGGSHERAVIINNAWDQAQKLFQ